MRADDGAAGPTGRSRSVAGAGPPPLQQASVGSKTRSAARGPTLPGPPARPAG